MTNNSNNLSAKEVKSMTKAESRMDTIKSNIRSYCMGSQVNPKFDNVEARAIYTNIILKGITGIKKESMEDILEELPTIFRNRILNLDVKLSSNISDLKEGDLCWVGENGGTLAIFSRKLPVNRYEFEYIKPFYTSAMRLTVDRTVSISKVTVTEKGAK